MLQNQKDIEWPEWIEKHDPSVCCLQETHFKSKNAYRLKVKRWKKTFRANRNKKKPGVAILISYKIDYKTKAIIRDKLHNDKEISTTRGHRRKN